MSSKDLKSHTTRQGLFLRMLTKFVQNLFSTAPAKKFRRLARAGQIAISMIRIDLERGTRGNSNDDL